MPESLTFTPDGTRILFPNPQEGHIVHAWNLRAIREDLATMNLDWDLPRYPPVQQVDGRAALRVEVDLGALERPALDQQRQGS